MLPPRPRWLYCAMFAWFAVTGGRFLAPFLEHEGKNQDYDESIVSQKNDGNGYVNINAYMN